MRGAGTAELEMRLSNWHAMGVANRNLFDQLVNASVPASWEAALSPPGSRTLGCLHIFQADAMSQTDRTLMRQISKKHRDLVQVIFEHRGANLSRDEFFHRTKEKWMTEPPGSGYMYGTTRYLGNRSQIKSLYGCTDEEAEAMVDANIYQSSPRRPRPGPDRTIRRRPFPPRRIPPVLPGVPPARPLGPLGRTQPFEP
jgi:hypothetical protein